MPLGGLLIHLADEHPVHVDGALVQAGPTHICRSRSNALYLTGLSSVEYTCACARFTARRNAAFCSSVPLVATAR